MWDSAFDYVRLTHTGVEDAEEIRSVYGKVCHLCVASQEGESISPKRWCALGYLGDDYGMAQAGAGPQGCILQAAGWAAQAVREANPWYTGVPRVDVQITVWYDRDPEPMIERIAEMSHAVGQSKGARAWKVNLVKGYGGGNTAYLGSRHSELYVRIYDKGKHPKSPKGYENALRYEIEVKGDRGPQLWAGAHRSAPDRHWCASVAKGILRSRGVVVPLPDQVHCRTGLSQEVRKATTESRLAWLATQVRPSIDKLLADGVHSSHIIKLLGLA